MSLPFTESEEGGGIEEENGGGGGIFCPYGDETYFKMVFGRILAQKLLREQQWPKAIRLPDLSSTHPSLQPSFRNG